MLGAIIAGTALQGAGAIAQTLQGYKQRKLNKNRLNQLLGEDHQFTIPDEFNQKVDLASYMAQRGLSDKALNFYKTNQERMLSASNATALELGGNVNDINKNFESAQRGLGDIAVKDASLQNDNLKALMDAKTELAGQKTMKWAIDYKTWQDNVERSRNEMAAGNQNMIKGLFNVGQLATNFGASNKGLLSSLFGNRNNSNPINPTTTQTNTLSDYYFNNGINNAGEGLFTQPNPTDFNSNYPDQAIV